MVEGDVVKSDIIPLFHNLANDEQVCAHACVCVR